MLPISELLTAALREPEPGASTTGSAVGRDILRARARAASDPAGVLTDDEVAAGSDVSLAPGPE